MLIRKLHEINNSKNTIEGETWVSRRLLLAADKMGFSMHDTILHAGTTTKMQYKNHLEAVYCIAGKGEIHDLETDTKHTIEAGTLYALDKHDRHHLIAHTELRMVCVFNPPLMGNETHDADGSYPLQKTE